MLWWGWKEIVVCLFPFVVTVRWKLVPNRSPGHQTWLRLRNAISNIPLPTTIEFQNIVKRDQQCPAIAHLWQLPLNLMTINTTATMYHQCWWRPTNIIPAQWYLGWINNKWKWATTTMMMTMMRMRPKIHSVFCAQSLPTQMTMSVCGCVCVCVHLVYTLNYTKTHCSFSKHTVSGVNLSFMFA